jgi:ElaB/YqjD/DUF883 family membrane-anchored ribosome-binding protein
MANSSFETFKEGGKAIDDAARKTGEQAETVYEQAKGAASDAYDSAADFAEGAVTKAGDAMGRVQESAAEIDDMVSEQVGRHPKAMVALSVGIGFALGFLIASSRGSREPSWRDYAARWRE